MLQGKVALVTGAGSGIGKAIAAAFSKHGAFTFVLDQNAESAEGVAKEIEQGGCHAAALHADVASTEQISKAFDQVRRRTPKLDILVNNAGIYVNQNALTLKEADWERCMNVDLKGAWLCAKHALPMMAAAGGGSVINIASTHAIRAQGNAFPYGVAKSGLLALTKSLAVDFGKDGIRVNSISPGLVQTPLTTDYFARNPALSMEKLAALQPLPVKIYGEDIANAALFLASEMARCITGVNLIVDGGRMAFSGFRHDK